MSSNEAKQKVVLSLPEPLPVNCYIFFLLFIGIIHIKLQVENLRTLHYSSEITIGSAKLQCYFVYIFKYMRSVFEV